MSVLIDPSKMIFAYSLTVPLGSAGLQNAIATAMRWTFIFARYHNTL